LNDVSGQQAQEDNLRRGRAWITPRQKPEIWCRK